MKPHPDHRGGSGMTPLVVSLVVALAGSGCASTPAGPPAPGEARGAVPSLGGVEVLVLPVQRTRVDREAADRELAFALTTRGPAVTWIGPVEIERRVSQSAMNLSLDRLPIDAFFQADVTRVGDPVYGILRRAASLTGALYAIIPLSLAPSPSSGPEAKPGLEVMATLIEIRTGTVFWIGTLSAEGDPADPATLARLMDELARTLLPLGADETLLSTNRLLTNRLLTNRVRTERATR
ncbi:MAG: hypothetical protein RQ745_00350 [Longimicrobiales bacterium]|nr:hypothetical protein [Longimicrobiales bacterium]